MSGKKFIPVIHVVYRKQMSRNISIARDNGADGVFLISHGGVSPKELIRLHEIAVNDNPDFWIGLNCLGLNGREVFKHVPKTIDGVWIDNGGVDEKGSKYAKLISRSMNKSNSNCIYFGGVAFKGQGFVKNVGKVAKLATEFMDVVTTSGMGTGKAASVKKIRSMKEAIGDYPLGLASGVTIDNVEDYLPYVDYFLVSTGISVDFIELDPQKVNILADKIHNYIPT